MDLCYSDILEMAIYVKKQMMYELDQRISDMVEISDMDLYHSDRAETCYVPVSQW